MSFIIADFGNLFYIKKYDDSVVFCKNNFDIHIVFGLMICMKLFRSCLTGMDTTCMIFEFQVMIF